MMPNRYRGEISAELGGRSFTLCLTLGALAELESAFGADDLNALAARFETGRLSAGDAIRILGAGIRGGGTAMRDEEIAALPDSLPAHLDAVARLLAATFGASEGGAYEETGADPFKAAAR